MPKMIDLDELNKVEEPYSRSKNIKTYEFLLEQCQNKIKECNRVHRSKHCLYKPPVFLIGKPMYDYFDVMNYIVEELVKNGLLAQITEQGIYVCWDPKLLNQVSYRQQLEKQEHSEKAAAVTKLKTEQVQSKPKPKPKSKRGEESRLVNVISFENDEFPVNLETFK